MKSKQTMIQEIREACIKANPSIKDLVFGCEVEYGQEVMKYLGFFPDHSDYGNGDDLHYFLKERGTRLCLGRGDVSRVEIIGREIRLADILFAVKERYLNGTLQRDGEFRNAMEWFGEISWDWDIKNDSLDSQSEETISFIHSLLFDNKESN